MKKLKDNKVFKIIKKVINVLLVIFCILFLLVVCLQRFSNNRLSIFNYRMFTVVSGSMEPKYTIGDVLIAKSVPADEIKVGDSISYEGKISGFDEQIVTHQVVRIEKDVDGNYIYHTKGLSNLVEDPAVYYNQVYGVVKHKSVVLSAIYKIVMTKFGMFIFIVIPIFYIVSSEMISYMIEKEEKRRNKA